MPNSKGRLQRKKESYKLNAENRRTHLASSMSYDAFSEHSIASQTLPSSNIKALPLYYSVRSRDVSNVSTNDGLVQDDVLLQGFKNWVGSKSEVVYFYDENDNVVVMMKIVLFKDMKVETLAMHQDVVTHLWKDSKLKPDNTKNHAQLAGHMRCMGWRAGYDAGAKMGQYALSSAGVTALKKDKEAVMKHLEDSTLRIHRLMAKNLLAICPEIHKQRREELRQHNIPLLGASAKDYVLDSLFDSDNLLFAAQLVYTFGGFWNTPHMDNDVNIWANAVWIPITEEGVICAEDKQGFKSEGGGFALLKHGLLIDFSSIKGVTEIMFRGSKDLHCTVGGKFKKGFTRLGYTTQINQRLDGACSGKIIRKGDKIMDIATRYGL